MTDHERDALDVRPTADEMLARIGGEASTGRGRLRVYLGMAPGVGKTYRMLEEAHRRVDRGTDLVVGYVETHGRPRTADLLDGLEVVPRRRTEYRGIVVEEMDTDALIARRPTVALVDEIAHTNAPGSARERRWQDVEAIRDAGIHVISTCNVQHLESIADAVATITGAPVNERIPDEVLADADEVELVDMSPHALRQRMRHGNVYPPERTQVALERFFTEANLTALREISLRFVARQVDEELEEIGTGAKGIGRSVAERVAVLMDDSPASRTALRSGATLASALYAPLLAIVVVLPADEGRSFDRERDLRENLDYAEDLGAEVVRVEGAEAVEALTDVLRRRRATHLILPYRESTDRRRLPSTVAGRGAAPRGALGRGPPRRRRGVGSRSWRLRGRWLTPTASRTVHLSYPQNPSGVRRRRMDAITAEGLVKIYQTRRTGPVRALDGLDLRVAEGTVLGLLGPNGAGKTTTVRILATLLRPDAGHATVAGYDVVRQAQELRSVIGLSGQYAAVDENLTGRENLSLFGRLYQLPRLEIAPRAGELLEQFELAEAADRVVKTYSGGMRRRLDLASALIGRPRLLFLDEPTTGLDPRSRLGMWDIIRELVREGTTLLLTTQYLEEADELADAIAVVDRGRIIASGTADELKAQVGGERIEVVVHDRTDIERAVELLHRDTGGDGTVDLHTRRITVPSHGGAGQLVQVVRDLDEASIRIDDIGLRRPTLDDVFLALTGHGSEADEANADADVRDRSKVA